MGQRQRPHFSDDPESWFSDDRIRGDIPDRRTEDDYRDFAEQATELAWDYQRRGREMIASYLLGLAGAAETHAEEIRDQREDRAASVDISIPFDETAPPEHRKDDIATILARILPLTDADESSSEEVARLWRHWTSTSRARTGGGCRLASGLVVASQPEPWSALQVNPRLSASPPRPGARILVLDFEGTPGRSVAA